jgi:hypothetical protein
MNTEFAQNRFWYHPYTHYSCDGSFLLHGSSLGENSGYAYLIQRQDKREVVLNSLLLQRERIMTPLDLSILPFIPNGLLEVYPNFLKPTDVYPVYIHILGELNSILKNPDIEITSGEINNLLKFMQNSIRFRDDLGVHNFVSVLLRELRRTTIEKHLSPIPIDVLGKKCVNHMSLYEYMVILLDGISDRLLFNGGLYATH